jgi:hypothetical protein
VLLLFIVIAGTNVKWDRGIVPFSFVRMGRNAGSCFVSFFGNKVMVSETGVRSHGV